jgi:TrmH family RNA methyltransferase
MALRIVQSKLNDRVKRLRSALRQPNRAPGLVGLEGLHLILEALQSGIQLETIFVAQGHEQLLSQSPLAQYHLIQNKDVLLLPRDILDSAVSTESPQPIAALAHSREWKPAQLFEKSPALIIVLAGIQDPGNLGTILRSAEAFGATGAITLPGTVSEWNTKAMRASAGSVFRLPVLRASEATCLEILRQAGIRTVAAMAHDAQPLSECHLTTPIAFLIGSEGNGLPPTLTAQCDARVTIPCPGLTESLNAAVAASILLYESSRQRHSPPPAHRTKARGKA